MYVWFSLILSYSGFLSLCLAMPRHFGELRGGKPGAGAQHLFRLAGASLLMISALAAAWAWPNLPVAVSAWAGLLTVAAFSLAMVLTYATPRNRRLLPLVPVLCMAVASLTSL